MKTIIFHLLFSSAYYSATAKPVNTPGSIVVPSGATNGIYLVTHDNEHIYLGPGNGSSVETRSTGHIEKLTSRADGPHCGQNNVLGNPDKTFAISAMAIWLDENKCFSSKSVYAVSGNTVAYGCNYFSKACQTENGYLSDNEAVDSACGSNAIGWYAHRGNGFGRTELGNGFC